MRRYLPLLITLGLAWGQNKVNVNNLFKHRNKYFKENDYFPYDGVVFDISKETRNKILQFRMLNRIKNGTYKEWYANGKPKTTGGYFNDDSTESWTKWYESGRKQSEKNYRNGKEWGLRILYHDNGIIKYINANYKKMAMTKFILFLRDMMNMEN